MTVKELIGVLSKLPPDHRVVVPAYEAGYATVDHVVHPYRVWPHEEMDADSYYGEFGDVYWASQRQRERPGEVVVLYASKDGGSSRHPKP